MTKRSSTGIRIPQKLLNDLDYSAEVTGLKRSQFIRKALEQQVSYIKTAHKQILNAAAKKNKDA